jgi:SSS family solute:Na+ symporter
MFVRIAAERPELLEAPGLAAGGSPWSWGEYSSAVVVSSIGFCMWPHLFMKAFTSRSEGTLRRTVLLYPTFQIFLVPLFLIGFSGVFFDPAPARADQVLPHMLMHMEIPAILVGLFCAGALAASMSSGDAMAHAAASVVVRDGLVSAFRMKLGPEMQRRAIRGSLVGILLLAYAVAVLYRGSLVNLLLSAFGAVVQFAPAVLATLYWRRASGWAVLAGLVAGTSLTVLLVLQPDLRPVELHAGLYGLALNAAVVVVGSLSARGDRSPATEEFLRVASGR